MGCALVFSSYSLRILMVFSWYSHGILMVFSGGPLRKPGTLICLCNQGGFAAVWGRRSKTKSLFHDCCRPNQERRLLRFRDAHACRESARRATRPEASLALIFTPFLCPSTKPQTKRRVAGHARRARLRHARGMGATRGDLAD